LSSYYVGKDGLKSYYLGTGTTSLITLFLELPHM